jgi:hypothetical protein
MKVKTVTFLILGALLLVACAAQEAAEMPFANGAAAPEMPAGEAGGDDFYARSLNGRQPQQMGEPGAERLIIRTGEMSIVVADTEEALQTIGDLATAMGGWVVSSNVYQVGEGSARSGLVTVRIPAADYEAYVQQVRELALEVRRENSDSEDVTEEYVDLTARLANLEATAERVRAFLDQAESVEEALAVNQELSRLEGEIESYKGRIQYLEQSAAFSTLSISLTPDELSQPIQVGGWRPQGVARDAIEALVGAFRVLATLLIWGVIFCLPIGLVLGVPLWLIVRFGRGRLGVRQKGRSNSEAETAEDRAGPV